MSAKRAAIRVLDVRTQLRDETGAASTHQGGSGCCIAMQLLPSGPRESVLETRPVFVGELAHRFELTQHQLQVRGPQ